MGARCQNCLKKIKDKQLLGKGERLCKNCLRKLPRCSCVFCKLSFHLLDSQRDAAVAAAQGASSSHSTGSSPMVSSPVACPECTERKAQFGEPKNCEYCQLRSAFVGSRCHYCTKSETRFGEFPSKTTPKDAANARHADVQLIPTPFVYL